MDIPLSSDALDLALHPNVGASDSDSHLLAVGLISGKVQLLDIAPFVRESRGEGSEASGSRGKAKAKKVRRASKQADDSDSESEGSQSSSSRTRGKGADGSKLYAKKWSARYKNKSCRGVEFDEGGSRLWCLSKDKTIYNLDTETGQVVDVYPEAHSAAPSRLLPLPGDSNMLVTGDDDGVVNLWDTRLKTKRGGATGSTEGGSVEPVRTYDHHFDWITDFHYSRHLIPSKLSREEKERREKEAKQLAEKKRKRDAQRGKKRDEDDMSEPGENDAPAPARERLVCTSGDGSLSVIDFRAGGSKGGKSTGANDKMKGVEVSEDQEDELLSITSVKGGTKLVVGTQLGMLSLWAPARGLLDHVDRIPGHPQSIDALLPLDDTTVLTGSSDGLVRVVQILPHKFLGVVADHGMGLPVERMKRREGVLVSCGHGNEVKVTDIGSLLDDGSDDEDEDDEDEAGVGGEVDAEQLALKMSGSLAPSDEEEDEEEGGAGDEDEDMGEGDGSDAEDDAGKDRSDSDSDSDSEDDESPAPAPPPTKKQARRMAALSAGGTHQEDYDRQDFFADL